MQTVPYHLGGTCRKGHLLTKETSYYRQKPQAQRPYLVCRLCKSETDKAYRQKNQQRIQDRQNQWRLQNKEKHWKTQRRHSLKKQYGITQEQFDAMWASQEGLCAICKTAPDLFIGSRQPHWLSLYVDHDHATGTVRGLLCWNCNVALGHFKDDLGRLAAAITYLRSGGVINFNTSSVVDAQSPLN